MSTATATRWKAALFAALAALVPLPLSAADPAPAADLAPDGVALVERAGRFYQNLPFFSVVVSTEVAGPAGQFGAKGSAAVILQQPNQLNAHLNLQAPDGVKDTRLVSDGKLLTIWTGPVNRYVQTPSPARLQLLFSKFLPGLDFTVAPDPKAKLLDGVTKLTVVGEEKVGEVFCQRLHLEHADGTSDVLFETGPQPFLRGVVVIDGKSGNQLRIRFDEWKTKLAPEPGDFTFVLPPGAQRMEAETVVK